MWPSPGLDHKVWLDPQLDSSVVNGVNGATLTVYVLHLSGGRVTGIMESNIINSDELRITVGAIAGDLCEV